MLVDGVEGAAQQVARLGVDLLDGVFQRGHGLGQVGVLRIEKLFALARGGQLVQRGQVDGAQRLNVAVQAVDVALQSLQAHVAFGDGLLDGGQIGLGIG